MKNIMDLLDGLTLTSEERAFICETIMKLCNAKVDASSDIEIEDAYNIIVSYKTKNNGVATLSVFVETKTDGIKCATTMVKMDEEVHIS